MSLYNGPPRGGTRGGKDQFSWDNVKNDKDRDYYLGHSVMASTGRWQKGRDILWYTRDKAGGLSEQQAELRAVKEREEQIMAEALGLKPKSVLPPPPPPMDPKELAALLRRNSTDAAGGTEAGAMAEADRIKGLGYTPGAMAIAGSSAPVHETLQGVGVPAGGMGADGQARRVPSQVPSQAPRAGPERELTKEERKAAKAAKKEAKQAKKEAKREAKRQKKASKSDVKTAAAPQAGRRHDTSDSSPSSSPEPVRPPQSQHQHPQQRRPTNAPVGQDDHHRAGPREERHGHQSGRHEERPGRAGDGRLDSVQHGGERGGRGREGEGRGYDGRERHDDRTVPGEGRRPDGDARGGEGVRRQDEREHGGSHGRHGELNGRGAAVATAADRGRREDGHQASTHDGPDDRRSRRRDDHGSDRRDVKADWHAVRSRSRERHDSGPPAKRARSPAMRSRSPVRGGAGGRVRHDSPAD